MQFNNKVLRGLMLVLSALAIDACSTHTKDSNDQSAVRTANSGYESSNISSSEQTARLQMQELKYNNIIYFDLDKYDIRSDFAQILDAHASFLRSKPSYKITIEGHTDERGTPEYNIALGERRANAVQMYLQDKGVSSDQISIISYGKEKPVVLGYDEATWSKNRRAVLVY